MEKDLAEKITPEMFRKERMDIRDSGEFFEERGIDPRDYRSSHLSVCVVGEGRIYDAEIKLAETALQEGYKFVTNLDYLNLRGTTGIAGRGWSEKT